ncbi:MAG: maleylpyruvate isomerase N-terminal domain-containing protein [Bryobacterales bacterium]|nr:maleylpyruvate isomerase N-terminal domain-containing protein [Bryobacterales bacterium]
MTSRKTAHLLGKLDGMPVELVRGLSAEDWERPTIAGVWRVKQVAAHLLDTQVRKLSMVRDGFWGEGPREGEGLVAFINRLNAEGAALYSRHSPAVLASLLEISGRESAAFHEGLDPEARAAFAVSWAGESESANWFDTARELTERWHHQQQIRLAVDKPGILTAEFYRPVMETFLLGAPYAYREIGASVGQAVRVEVSGEAGGVWWLVRGEAGWALRDEEQGEVAASVMMPQEVAWRVFTKGIPREEAMAVCRVEGDAALGGALFRLTAIVG